MRGNQAQDCGFKSDVVDDEEGVVASLGQVRYW